MEEDEYGEEFNSDVSDDQEEENFEKGDQENENKT
jgi:hypothetical protein